MRKKVFTFQYGNGWSNKTTVLDKEITTAKLSVPLLRSPYCYMHYQLCTWIGHTVLSEMSGGGFSANSEPGTSTTWEHLWEHRGGNAFLLCTEEMIHTCTSHQDNLLRLDPLTNENGQVKLACLEGVKNFSLDPLNYLTWRTQLWIFSKRGSRGQNAEPVCLTSLIPVMGKSLDNLLESFERGCFQKHLKNMGFYDNSKRPLIPRYQRYAECVEMFGE